MNEVTRVVVHPHSKWKKHDIALVVPCYDEWIWVLETLYSAAIEAGRSNCKIAVFLVVNNKADCAPELLEENRRTAKLAVDIMRWKELGHKKQSGYYYEERKKIERIRNSGITVWLVDCYTERNAPEECNVWYARDVWTRSILDFLQNDNCVIAHTDADCRLLRNYFKSLEEYYFPFKREIPSISWETDEDIEVRKKSRTIALFELEDIQITTWWTGTSFKKWEEDIRSKVVWVERFENLMKVFMRGDILDISDERKTTPETPGANHQYRKWLFIEIGWYRRMGWAEDTTFWMKAQSLWHKVHRIDLNVSTQCRPSERTVEWHGMWFEMKRKGSWPSIHALTHSVQYLSVLKHVYDILKDAHASDDFWAFVRDSEIPLIFPWVVAEQIISIYEEYSWWEEMKGYEITWILSLLNSTVRNELRKMYPRKPVHEVLWEAMFVIDNDSMMLEFMEKLKMPYINRVKITPPKDISDEEALQWYCTCASTKLFTYNLLKSAFSYMGIFTLMFNDFQSENENSDINLKDCWFDSLDELNSAVLEFIIDYWKKIIANLIAETTSWEAREKSVEIIENMFGEWKIDDEYIRKMANIDKALDKLNEKYGASFLDMWRFFNASQFVRRYTIYD